MRLLTAAFPRHSAARRDAADRLRRVRVPVEDPAREADAVHASRLAGRARRDLGRTPGGSTTSRRSRSRRASRRSRGVLIFHVADERDARCSGSPGLYYADEPRSRASLAGSRRRRSPHATGSSARCDRGAKSDLRRSRTSRSARRPRDGDDAFTVRPLLLDAVQLLRAAHVVDARTGAVVSGVGGQGRTGAAHRHGSPPTTSRRRRLPVRAARLQVRASRERRRRATAGSSPSPASRRPPTTLRRWDGCQSHAGRSRRSCRSSPRQTDGAALPTSPHSAGDSGQNVARRSRRSRAVSRAWPRSTSASSSAAGTPRRYQPQTGSPTRSKRRSPSWSRISRYRCAHPRRAAVTEQGGTLKLVGGGSGAL